MSIFTPITQIRNTGSVTLFDDDSGVPGSAEINTANFGTFAFEIKGSSGFERNVRILGNIFGDINPSDDERVPLYRANGERVEGDIIETEEGIFFADVGKYRFIRGRLTHPNPQGTVSVKGVFKQNQLNELIFPGDGISVSGSRIQRVIWDANNLPSPGLDGFFEPRTDGFKFYHQVPHFMAGIFEQGFIVINNLDEAISGFRITGNGSDAGSDLISANFIQADIQPGERAWFMSEKGESVLETPTDRLIYEVPELRLPYPHLRFVYVLDEAPTTGDVAIHSLRRF